MRKSYGQRIIEKYLAEHKVQYVAGVEYSIGWYESCDTEAGAMQLLRELVEADGHHVFMRYNPASCGYYHEGKKLIGSIMWCNTLTGKTETKRITVRGALLTDIKELDEYYTYLYSGRFQEWEALHGEKY